LQLQDRHQARWGGAGGWRLLETQSFMFRFSGFFIAFIESPQKP
jgi:hypothetical protein